MKTTNTMQLKAIIRNRGEEFGITSRLVMQNFEEACRTVVEIMGAIGW